MQPTLYMKKIITLIMFCAVAMCAMASINYVKFRNNKSKAQMGFIHFDFIMQPLRFLLLRQGMESGVTLTLTVFVLTMLLEWPLLWLLKTYAPRFTAQKPLFLPGWRLN